jgi:hypothetical protein
MWNSYGMKRLTLLVLAVLLLGSSCSSSEPTLEDLYEAVVEYDSFPDTPAMKKFYLCVGEKIWSSGINKGSIEEAIAMTKTGVNYEYTETEIAIREGFYETCGEELNELERANVLTNLTAWTEESTTFPEPGTTPTTTATTNTTSTSLTPIEELQPLDEALADQRKDASVGEPIDLSGGVSITVTNFDVEESGSDGAHYLRAFIRIENRGNEDGTRPEILIYCEGNDERGGYFSDPDLPEFTIPQGTFDEGSYFLSLPGEHDDYPHGTPHCDSPAVIRITSTSWSSGGPYEYEIQIPEDLLAVLNAPRIAN